MWILRLNMTDRTYRLEEVPAAYKNLGGRGLTSTMVAAEVPPGCHPLGPNNKLVFAPGIVTGTSGFHLRPGLRGRQISADRRYQGVECRLILAAVPGNDADQGPRGGRPTQR